jgi:hypothetical protein
MVDIEKAAPPLTEKNNWIKSLIHIPERKLESRLSKRYALKPDRIKLRMISQIDPASYSHKYWLYILVIWTVSILLTAVPSCVPLKKRIGDSYIGEYLLRILVIGLWDFNLTGFVLLVTITFTGVPFKKYLVIQLLL